MFVILIVTFTLILSRGVFTRCFILLVVFQIGSVILFRFTVHSYMREGEEGPLDLFKDHQRHHPFQGTIMVHQRYNPDGFQILRWYLHSPPWVLQSEDRLYSKGHLFTSNFCRYFIKSFNMVVYRGKSSTCAFWRSRYTWGHGSCVRTDVWREDGLSGKQRTGL